MRIHYTYMYFPFSRTAHNTFHPLGEVGKAHHVFLRRGVNEIKDLIAS